MSTQTMAEYRQLGKSGLRVSVPIFGAMSFGDRRWNSWVIEEEQELELLPYCEYKGIGVVAYSPLLTGLLARPVGAETDRSKATIGSPFEKKLRESDSKIVRRVEELAQKKSWSMSHVALAWVASKTTSPIVGLSKVERLDQSITTGKVLSDEDIKYLEELYEIQRPRF
ncbi:hypothetical protein GSI_10340 [Ganoderma sinense ZZ0214-1]|uniref:NADP-dependent oxidoreductase domain-containing protein n=1 Tax=Ganoderma sinense ZZ0214-1 TaxID=1077348 RepID=A0A2G8S0C5_9APHY|nr:hypothetical protein GSI_10340 [Ganoderma sinense ZZ0214-1]